MNIKKISTALLLASSLLYSGDCIPKEDAVSLDEFLKETSRYEKLIGIQEKKIQLLEKEKNELQKQLSSILRSKDEVSEAEKNSKSEPKKENIEKVNQNRPSANLTGLQTITVQEAKIFIDKSQKFSPYSLFKDEKVEIELCDTQGWCKLKDKNLFVKQLSILPAN